MSTIPLVALSVRPTATPQDLQAQQMQLKNLAGQNAMIPGQLQQQQQSIQRGQQELTAGDIQNKSAQLALQDQMTMRQLAQKYLQRDSNGNVTGFDFQGFANEAQGKGIDPARIQQIQMAHAQAVKTYADAGESTLANDQAHNKAAFEVIEGIKPISDPGKRQAAYQQGLSKLQGMGVDTSTLPQAVPDNDTLTDHEATLGMHQQILDDAKKVADINKSQSDEFKEVPGTGIFFNPVSGESKLATGGPTMSPQMMEAKYVQVQQAMKLGQPVSDQDKAFASSYEKMKTLVPVMNFNLQNVAPGTNPGAPLSDAIVNALGAPNSQLKLSDVLPNRAPESVRQAALKQVLAKYPNYSSGDFALEQSVKKEFTSGDAAKNLTAFNTAIEHSQQLRQAADALDNNNVPLANRFMNAVGYQTGSDKMTNFNVIKSALSGEISKVFKGGQATDAEIKEVQEPFSAANSPAQLRGAIDNAIKLMNSKRDALQQQYAAGVQAKPNFGNGAPSQFKVTDPRGKDHYFPDQQSADNFKRAANIQ